MKPRCPVCHRIVKVLPREQAEGAQFFPFCSRRCKLVDLGAWLDADYKMVSKLHPQESSEPLDTSSDVP